VHSLKLHLGAYEERGLSAEDAEACADQLAKLRNTVEKIELCPREQAAGRSIE
jgi:hypothetical protein